MHNDLTLIGRLTKDPKKGDKFFTIAVGRNYKNEEGMYETDFINVYMRDIIAENVIEYYKKGELIGVKGRIETRNNGQLKVIAEKISYLAMKREG